MDEHDDLRAALHDDFHLVESLAGRLGELEQELHAYYDEQRLRRSPARARAAAVAECRARIHEALRPLVVVDRMGGLSRWLL